MEKITFKQAKEIIKNHNLKNGITSQYQDRNPLILNIVYEKSNWSIDYTELQRTYQTRSDEKFFINPVYGNSLYGNCLDGKDLGVRLDWYGWVIEYCFFSLASLRKLEEVEDNGRKN